MSGSRRLTSSLTEMDGFEGNNGCHHFGGYQPAGIPGPCADRAPGVLTGVFLWNCRICRGSEAILKVHAKKIKLADDVDFRTIARMAARALPAQSLPISSTKRRCVRCAAARTVVEQSDLEESIEVVIAGYQKKNAVSVQ